MKWKRYVIPSSYSVYSILIGIALVGFGLHEMHAQMGHYPPPSNATEQGTELTSDGVSYTVRLDVGIDTKPGMRQLSEASYTMECAREDGLVVAGPFEGRVVPNGGHAQIDTGLTDVKTGDHIITSTKFTHDATPNYNRYEVKVRDEMKLPAPRSGPPVDGDGRSVLQRSRLRFEFSSVVPRAGHAWSVKAIPGDPSDSLEQPGFSYAIIFLYRVDGSHYDLPVPASESVFGADGSLDLRLSDATMGLVHRGDHLEIEWWRTPSLGEPIGTRSELITEPAR